MAHTEISNSHQEQFSVRRHNDAVKEVANVSRTNYEFIVHTNILRQLIQ